MLWTIETSGERGYGKSMPAARYDDDIVSTNYFFLIKAICLHTVIWFQVFLSNTNNSHSIN